ncbi:glycosyltransferase [Sulfitobacter sp. F26169L]|uniref:glycosyltransferase family 2 protein n=1 Tax=Sulfitobacter sp. F26169L TaxID=2996015 RepID=UPI0022608ED6|nr:glycosyltransferase family 2 protein [Sulfitobacter sp. F26169L]MCX7564946.1 glycosyltransferase [Sulfitobacter sp. F26169L]
MSDLYLRLPDPMAATPPVEQMPLGWVMVNAGIITQSDLEHALNLQRHIDAPLGEILVAEGLADPDDVLQMLSRQHNIPVADLTADPPDPRLSACLPSSLCLAHRCVPWLRIGDVLLVGTNHPADFNRLRACMGERGRRMLPVLVDELEIRSHISTLYGAELAQRAATRVPAAQSCRGWNPSSPLRKPVAVAVVCALLAALFIAPLWTITIGMLFAFATLVFSTVLKLAAFIAQISKLVQVDAAPVDRRSPPFPLPKVSVLVPLLQEKEIAGKLIQRLTRLTYPKSLLEVVLVLEADDTVTRDTIARTDMPNWMSVIEVPSANNLTTKPRALNYALDFCRGSIIGVWDAEDAPEPDQIEKVVTRFQDAPENVACLQGVLDYYNPKANWLSRCFAIEYATWWRMILPGIAQLGLVIPLGGTTLFFRRSILEKLCGWDAHNVTEDADLGVRLARHGYVTELIPTVTYEEANCRAWPWVKQRSRWLKGFLITWIVHMRAPRALLRDLGFMRFLGVQTLLFATFAQFACAPLLWSFWITLAGFNHPVALTLGAPTANVMAWVFLLSAVLNLLISMVAVSRAEHRHLMGYVLTLPFYFPMAALSAYKALKEMVAAPFYWDKTQHGVTSHTD